MHRVVFFFIFWLVGCVSSGERVLSSGEAARHGLTGVIYDAPLCETKFSGNVQMVSGDCEYVTCNPHGKGVRCVARKKQ